MSHDWRNPERVVPWKPRHPFQVTAAGAQAARQYRELVSAAQASVDARLEIDRVKLAWASGLGLRSEDGILLEEMAGGTTTLAGLQSTMEACNLSLRDARGVIDRLVAAGLIVSADAGGAPTSFRDASRDRA